MEIPDDLLYTEEHEWIRQVGDSLVRIGITDYAQDQLGDVVYVELPPIGKEVAKDDVLVEVESTKSVGEVYAPFAGTVTNVNENISQSPELVNQSPYEDGWLILMSVDGEMPTDRLLDAARYRNLTE
ncbi:MAG TPA: glycine cleavage system protein GcvH [Acidimicrobiia bacterium]|jgi:glycine cleavage system H protein|nr:glycine cleavage system protein [Acidimicrobiia bacterium]HYJ26027.1 glycine cleavage system protein GcvH [Acidimicrobiia bacterium]